MENEEFGLDVLYSDEELQKILNSDKAKNFFNFLEKSGKLDEKSISAFYEKFGTTGEFYRIFDSDKCPKDVIFKELSKGANCNQNVFSSPNFPFSELTSEDLKKIGVNKFIYNNNIPSDLLLGILRSARDNYNNNVNTHSYLEYLSWANLSNISIEEFIVDDISKFAIALNPTCPPDISRSILESLSPDNMKGIINNNDLWKRRAISDIFFNSSVRPRDRRRNENITEVLLKSIEECGLPIDAVFIDSLALSPELYDKYHSNLHKTSIHICESYLKDKEGDRDYVIKRFEEIKSKEIDNPSRISDFMTSLHFLLANPNCPKEYIDMAINDPLSLCNDSIRKFSPEEIKEYLNEDTFIQDIMEHYDLSMEQLKQMWGDLYPEIAKCYESKEVKNDLNLDKSKLSNAESIDNEIKLENSMEDVFPPLQPVDEEGNYIIPEVIAIEDEKNVKELKSVNDTIGFEKNRETMELLGRLYEVNPGILSEEQLNLLGMNRENTISEGISKSL